MDRRQFLGTSAAVVGTGIVGWYSYWMLSWPSLGNAYRKAVELGKPLLILVIPEDRGEKRERGGVFGELLNHGGTDAFLDLALCEVACATVAHVRKTLRFDVAGEPLMLLAEPAGARTRGTPVDPEVSYDKPQWVWIDGNHNGAEIDGFIRQRIGTVAAALRDSVASDRNALAERAWSAEARLPADEVGALRAAFASGAMPERSALDRAAAVARFEAEDPRAPMPRVLEALATTAAARVQRRPVGARWARSGGCGVEVEGEPPPNIGCGMGHVSDLSERFLWFFSRWEG